jgi:hypothetical protein
MRNRLTVRRKYIKLVAKERSVQSAEKLGQIEKRNWIFQKQSFYFMGVF